MRVISLSLFIFFLLGASAVRTKQATHLGSSNEGACITVESVTETEVGVPEVFTTEAEAEVGEVVITEGTVGGETVTAFIPEENYAEAPLAVVETAEEETYIVQVLESYETENGENNVVVNIGGESVTVEGEVIATETGIAVVETEGEITVAEVIETFEEEGETYIEVVLENGETEVIEGVVIQEAVEEIPEELIEIPEEFPSVLVEESESTPELEVIEATIGGETITSYVPEDEDFEEEAPLVAIETAEEETFVVQVLESYETEEGEHNVVVNIGGGETVTIEAEVIPTETGLAVIEEEGETYVVEVLEAYESEGETIIVTPGTEEGETERIEGVIITEAVEEIPTELIEAEEEIPAVCA